MAPRRPNPVIQMLRFRLHGLTAPLLLATAGIANILVLTLLMYRDKKAHPAYLSAAIGSLVMLVPMTVGDMQWWRNVADSLFTI